MSRCFQIFIVLALTLGFKDLDLGRFDSALCGSGRHSPQSAQTQSPSTSSCSFELASTSPRTHDSDDRPATEALRSSGSTPQPRSWTSTPYPRRDGECGQWKYRLDVWHLQDATQSQGQLLRPLWTKMAGLHCISAEDGRSTTFREEISLHHAVARDSVGSAKAAQKPSSEPPATLSEEQGQEQGTRQRAWQGTDHQGTPTVAGSPSATTFEWRGRFAKSSMDDNATPAWCWTFPSADPCRAEAEGALQPSEEGFSSLSPRRQRQRPRAKQRPCTPLSRS